MLIAILIDAPTVGELIDPTELEIIEKLLRQKSYVTNETVHRDVVEPVQYILEFQEIAVACYNDEKPSYGLVSILYIDDIFSERSKYITAYKGGVMTPTEFKPGRNQQRYVDVPNHYLR